MAAALTPPIPNDRSQPLQSDWVATVVTVMEFQLSEGYDKQWLEDYAANFMNRWIGFCSSILILIVCPALRAQDNRFVVFESGKYGYINDEGKLVIPRTLQGTYVIAFSEGLAAFAERVEPRPAKLPYVDKDGKLRIFPAEKWGFIDIGGNVVIAPQFDDFQDFSGGLAGVAFDTENTKPSCSHCDPNRIWGFIDNRGMMVVKPQYHSVRPFSEGLAAIENNEEKWGYINSKGELVIPFSFEYAGEFSEGLAEVSVNKLVGYINPQGKFIIKPRFTLASRFSEGLAAVRVGGKTGSTIIGPTGGAWSYIGKDGSQRIKLPKDAEQIGDFHEGAAVVEIKGHCGYVDSSGKVLIPNRYDSCEDFSEGLADVMIDGHWQYIDKADGLVLAVPYWGVHPFKNGLAAIEEGAVGPDQKFGYIDKHGNQVWKPRPAL
jgi:hypothetical protein